MVLFMLLIRVSALRNVATESFSHPNLFQLGFLIAVSHNLRRALFIALQIRGKIIHESIKGNERDNDKTMYIYRTLC